jgi:hypothetical protein
VVGVARCPPALVGALVEVEVEVEAEVALEVEAGREGVVCEGCCREGGWPSDEGGITVLQRHGQREGGVRHGDGRREGGRERGGMAPRLLVRPLLRPLLWSLLRRLLRPLLRPLHCHYSAMVGYCVRYLEACSSCAMLRSSAWSLA